MHSASNAKLITQHAEQVYLMNYAVQIESYDYWLI